MLKLPEITVSKVEAEKIDCNPCPAVLLQVSSLVANKYHNVAMDKTVKFEENFQGKKRTQFLAAFAANMGAFAIGTMMVWTATALPDLRRSNSLGSISESQESLISAVVTLGAAVACPWTGYCVETFGRRMTMLVLTGPFVVGWLLIAFAQHISMLYSGRFITGFCGGAFSLAAPIFIAETADIDIRGKLSAGFDMMTNIGMLFVFLVGKYFTWRIQAFICGFIPVIFHLLMFFVPESPRYLIAKGKDAEAAKALLWFRGALIPEQVQAEFIELVKSINERKESVASLDWKSSLCHCGAFKAVAIGMALFFFQVACGIDAILFYTVDIFRSAASPAVDEYSSAIILGTAQVLGALCAALTVDKYGRRFFLMVSELLMILALIAFGTFFYFKLVDDEDFVTRFFSWVPLISLILYVVAFSIGLGPLPYGIMAEILPLNIKGFGSSMLLTTRWLLCFLMTRYFNDMMMSMGPHGGYWILAIVCTVGALFIYLFVPETKGKSLEEIQHRFTRSGRP